MCDRYIRKVPLLRIVERGGLSVGQLSHAAEGALIKKEQCLVDLEDIVVPLFDKVLDDDIELTATAQCIETLCELRAGT